jgi:hypothetical protein
VTTGQRGGQSSGRGSNKQEGRLWPGTVRHALARCRGAPTAVLTARGMVAPVGHRATRALVAPEPPP